MSGKRRNVENLKDYYDITESQPVGKMKKVLDPKARADAYISTIGQKKKSNKSGGAEVPARKSSAGEHGQEHHHHHHQHEHEQPHRETVVSLQVSDPEATRVQLKIPAVGQIAEKEAGGK
ncbi:MAG: hypothetical protein P4M11_08690 [Candidatus Pacebacteria bacterium]|nr:hypothetical protein [Candidatus Paceibacterota bacterium]